MEQGFHHADQRHNDFAAVVNQRFHDLEGRMERGFDQVDQRLTQVDQRFGQVDHRFDRLESRMERGFSDLRQEMDRFRQTTTRQLWVMVGIMSSAIIGTLIKLLFFPSP